MILAITGGKGGVGKTTVAFNLAAELDAVVVDADLGMADLPDRRGPDLHDVLAGRATAVEAVDESGAVDLLPCGRSLAGTRACDVTELAGALADVETEFERVVVDCPAGLGTDCGVALHASDACIVVTTREAVAMADALRTRALARRLEAGLALVVVNRATATGRARDAFGAPAVALPASEDVARAMAHGLPVVDLAPESRSAARFDELAGEVRRAVRTW